MKIFTLGFVLASALVAQAQTFPETKVKGPDYTITARAYIDPSLLPGSKLNPASRYDFRISTTPGASYQWDFVLPDQPNIPETNIAGAFSSTDYKTRQKTTLRATLHKFEIYEEKVTFKDLDLVPVTHPDKAQPAFLQGPRFLSLPQARNQTTPSGIKITLTPQTGLKTEDWNSVYNGNIEALWVRLRVAPNTRLSSLPDSPLFRKHGRPVSIKLEVPEPNFLVSYMADNTFTGIKVGLPKLETLTHLDQLTFIVRQRVDLETVPVAIEVPISKPVH